MAAVREPRTARTPNDWIEKLFGLDMHSADDILPQPEVRRLLTDAVTGLNTQMVLRVGYGKISGRSPRRPVAEVLLPDRT